MSPVHAGARLLAADVGDAYASRFDFLKDWFWSGMGAVALTLLLYAPILLKDAGLLLSNRFARPLVWDGYPFIVLPVRPVRHSHRVHLP